MLAGRSFGHRSFIQVENAYHCRCHAGGYSSKYRNAADILRCPGVHADQSVCAVLWAKDVSAYPVWRSFQVARAWTIVHGCALADFDAFFVSFFPRNS
jgi:hypothetical protein